MIGQASPELVVEVACIEAVVKRLVDVPDKLMTARRSLQPLSDDGGFAPAETKQIVIDACDLLQAALADVVDVARDLAALYAVDALVSTATRVRTDSYYGLAP